VLFSIYWSVIYDCVSMESTDYIHTSEYITSSDIKGSTNVTGLKIDWEFISYKTYYWTCDPFQTDDWDRNFEHLIHTTIDENDFLLIPTI
jgi:hypothetical protein